MRNDGNYDTSKPDELYQTITTPSVINSYSIAMQYIKDWFFSKFDENYFKAKYIEQRHPLDDFRKLSTINKGLKKLKPSVSIGSQISLDYTRDTIDLYQASPNDFLRRTKFNNAFFMDKQRNLNLSVMFEVLEINFNFKIRVGTRAQQIDLYKYLIIAFRFGATQGEELTMDCHIPYPIMIQIASDAGFEVKDDKVVDIIGFMRYMNKHSVVPILYKYRTINGKDEYFMRVSNLYTHISCLDFPTVDDGEQNNQIYTNYMIEFNIILKIPSPQFYAYHSNKIHDKIEGVTKRIKGDSVGLCNIKIPTIPEVDQHGWNQYLLTEYYSDEIEKCIDIDMKELFENSDIFSAVKQSRDMYISPAVFINLIFFNNGDVVPYKIDWETFKVTLLEPIYGHVVQISMYADIDYLKTTIYNQEKFKERYSKSIEDKK